MYAIIETGSKQYRVAVGDTLEIERLEVEKGQTHTFNHVFVGFSNAGRKRPSGRPTWHRLPWWPTWWIIFAVRRKWRSK